MKRAILLTTSSISAAIFAALATIALVGLASGGKSALAASSLDNGSFETGSLSGWTVDTTAAGFLGCCPGWHPGASAVASYIYVSPDCSWGGSYVTNCPDMLPQEGSYFALLSPGRESNATTKMISKPFTASNGDKVSGWAFFGVEQGDYSATNKGQVVVKRDSGTTVATPFEENGFIAGNYGYGGWKYWEHTFTDVTGEGDFHIEAQVNNSASTIFYGSVMGLDDVKTSTSNGPDTTKPSTTATPSPAPNSAGWNNSDVKVHLSATDNEGGWGVKKITYSASGAQTIANTDTSGSSADINLSAAGTTTLTYYATDNAGNVEDQKTLTLKIDKSAPTVTDAKATTSPNANGWYNTNVTNKFTASDSTSGLADSTHASFSKTTTGEGSAVTVNSGDVYDKAGNKASANSAAFKIDKTAPAIAKDATNKELVTPANEATGVSRSTKLTAAFAEQNMDTTTLTGTTVTVQLFSGTSTKPIKATVSYDATTKTVTLTPFAKLAGNTKYTVKITNGVKDLAGNAFAGTQWSFTAGAN
jgi:hypothetical protein